jgi:predicted transposase YbfD/YdcC
MVMSQRERRIADQVLPQTADWIASLPADAKRLLHALRAHWSVENTFHCSLDVTFREDDARLRSGDSSQHFTAALHDHFLLDLLAQV